MRELENTLERMVVASDDGPVLTTGHLPEAFAEQALDSPRARQARSLDSPAPRTTRLRRRSTANGFSRQRAAAALGLSRHQLYRLVRDSPSLAVRLGTTDAVPERSRRTADAIRPRAQAGEPAIVVVARAAERHAEPIGDVAERQLLEADQLEGRALPFGQLFEAGAKEPAALLPRQQRLRQRARGSARISSSSIGSPR